MERIILNWNINGKNDKEALLILKEGVHDQLFSKNRVMLICNPVGKKDKDGGQASTLQIQLMEELSLLKTNVQPLVHKIVFESAAIGITLRYQWTYHHEFTIKRKLRMLVPQLEFI